MSQVEYGAIQADVAQNAITDLDRDVAQNAITDLDRQIDRMRELISLLETKLAPVSRGMAASEKMLTSPQPAPSSPLQGRAQTLGDQCARLDQIICDLDI